MSFFWAEIQKRVALLSEKNTNLSFGAWVSQTVDAFSTPTAQILPWDNISCYLIRVWDYRPSNSACSTLAELTHSRKQASQPVSIKDIYTGWQIPTIMTLRCNPVYLFKSFHPGSVTHAFNNYEKKPITWLFWASLFYKAWWIISPAMFKMHFLK